MKYKLIFLGFFFPFFAFSQVELKNEFELFLSELGTYTTLSCDCNTTEINMLENWSNLKIYFLSNTTIYNECAGIDQSAEDYFKNYIPTIKKSRCNTNFEYAVSNFRADGKLFKANVLRKAVYSGKELSSMQYTVVFSYKKDEDPTDDNPSIRIIKMENYENTIYPKNLKSALCSPPKIKVKTGFPITLMIVGGAAIAGSFYFQRESNNFYNDYKTTFPSANSEELYTDANNSHHNKLILRYTGVGLTAIGTTILTAKLIKRKKIESLSNADFQISPTQFYFAYNF